MRRVSSLETALELSRLQANAVIEKFTTALQIFDMAFATMLYTYIVYIYIYIIIYIYIYIHIIYIHIYIYIFIYIYIYERERIYRMFLGTTFKLVHSFSRIKEG